MTIEKRIEVRDGIVTNVAMVDTSSVPEHLVDWQIGSDDVGPGWTFDGTDFAPPPVDIDAARDRALQKMRGTISATARSVTGTYPQEERESWPQKEAAARAILAGTPSASDTALIGAEATILGVTPEDRAQLIVTNADIFRSTIGTLSGIRSVTETALAAATSETEIETAMSTMRSLLQTVGGRT